MPHFETSDGVRLHYLDEGTGRPVVLVAGFKASATTWVFQQRHLLAQGYRVLALDRRGHGDSDSPAHGARMARHGRDLGEFLAATNLTGSDAPVLVGGSMGASTIWAYLDQGAADTARGIVLVDQTPKMANEGDWSHGYYGYSAENLGTFFAAGPPPTGYGTPIEERGERLARVLEAMQSGRAAGTPPVLTPTELALLRDHAVQDWRDVIARVRVPALYVAGRDSELWPCEHAAACADLNPLARSVVIEDCGHAANIEQPDAFNALLDEFLGTLP